jgi:hypothetical protein
MITVEGPPPADATRTCTLEDDFTDGRWISRKHIDPAHLVDDSPLHDWVQSHVSLDHSSRSPVSTSKGINFDLPFFSLALTSGVLFTARPYAYESQDSD